MEQINSFGDRAGHPQMTGEERLDAFKRVIAHPHLIAAGRTLREAIREPGGALLIFVCGPAGVGKTTLKKYALEWDRERAPILSLVAKPPLNGSFSWTEFLQCGISTLQQPLIDRKDTGNFDNDKENTKLAQVRGSQSGSGSLKRVRDDDLRISLETAIDRHFPAAVIIDDAQYLGRVSGKRQMRDQLDCLKSMAEATETVHVLIGSYELFNLYDVCMQSTARSFFVHFPRYGSTDEELSRFKNVLRTLQQFLPFEEETDLLLKHWEFCYERSLGCVGILHFMLARAVCAALRAEERKLGRAYLERYALSEAECYVMMRQIYGAERDLACRSAPTELRQLLGLAPHIAFGSEISGNFSEKDA